MYGDLLRKYQRQANPTENNKGRDFLLMGVALFLVFSPDKP
jgi:hypothetical protein